MSTGLLILHLLALVGVIAIVRELYLRLKPKKRTDSATAVVTKEFIEGVPENVVGDLLKLEVELVARKEFSWADKLRSIRTQIS